MKRWEIFYLAKATRFSLDNPYRDKGLVEKSKVVYSKSKDLAREAFRIDNPHKPITKINEVL